MELTKSEKRTRTMLSNLINEQHPVALAVEPYRTSVLERTEKTAKATVEKVRAELAAAGNDLNKCAPYPDYHHKSNHQYLAEQAKYNLFHAVCKPREYVSIPKAPNPADVDSKKVTKYVADCMERAAVDYDAFIVKLCGKIGTCDSATITGTHVWGYSILTVTKGKTVENWKTQQIMNTSKLGRLFNQWPSRKVKS